MKSWPTVKCSLTKNAKLPEWGVRIFSLCLFSVSPVIFLAILIGKFLNKIGQACYDWWKWDCNLKEFNGVSYLLKVAFYKWKPEEEVE